MPRRSPNPLSNAGLDRLAALRADAAALTARLADAHAVPVRQGQVCVHGNPPRVATVPVAGFEERTWLLGEVDGRTYVAIDLDGDDVGDVLVAVPDDVRWTGLREVASLLPPEDANVLATATALAAWHANHRYCGTCGSPTSVDLAGHRRVCGACGREHFPRTDPAVIVLVTHRDRALLARNPNWPAGFASVLAGFVEPGESLEDAVAREVYEEAGVHVGEIEYHSSQPWPFPSSIMLGFTAQATTEVLSPDPTEIADVAWYTRDEIRAGKVAIPPPVSIARRLIDDWLSGIWSQ